MVNKQYTANDLEAFMKIAANWQSSNQNLLEGMDLKPDMAQYMNNSSMNMYKKRERTQNWNHQEKKFLLDLCRKDMRIIENKRLDAGLTAVKNKAWKIIHQKFSNQFGTDRTCNRLKEQWRRMKACTRNEIIDYNNRLTRFGAEVADRKKPSPFTFEVWEFMQEAKKACKSEALDGIDYSKLPLALEEDFDYKFKSDEEHDMDDSSRTPPQQLCDVDIKEEETNETFNGAYNDTFNDTYNDSQVNGERLSASPQSQSRNGQQDVERVSLHSPVNTSTMEPNGAYLPQGADISSFQPNFNMNNISATLEALNALRTGQFPSAAAAAVALQQQQQAQAAAAVALHAQTANNNHNNNNNNNNIDEDDTSPLTKRPRTSSTSISNEDQQQQQSQHEIATTTSAIERVNSAANSTSASSIELRHFMDMQNKEHMMRMKILEVQLQTAKYNRDLVEINKTLALQKLQEIATKRLAS